MGRRVKMKLGPPVRGWRPGARRGGVYYDGDAGSMQDALIFLGDSEVVEARALGLEKMLLVNLDHPSVLPLLSLAVAPGKNRPVYAYAYIEGAGLGAALQAASDEEGHLPLGVAASAIAQVAAAAHAVCTVGAEMAGHGIWHPGPTPDDVLIDATGVVRAVGFQVWHADAQPEGVAGFMSPEGGLGAPGIAYGLGALLMVLLGGEPPAVEAGQTAESFQHAVEQQGKAVHQLRGPAATHLVELAKACVSWSPDQRPPLGVLAARLEELRLRSPAPGPVLWSAQAVPKLRTGAPLGGELTSAPWVSSLESRGAPSSTGSASRELQDQGDRPTEVVDARSVGLGSAESFLHTAGQALDEASGELADPAGPQWSSRPLLSEAEHAASTRLERSAASADLEEPVAGVLPKSGLPQAERTPGATPSALETHPDTLSSPNAGAPAALNSTMPLPTQVWMVVTSVLTLAVVVSLILRFVSVF